MTQHPPTLLARAMTGFGRRVVVVPATGWDRPTPCADWTVRALVDHVIEEERWAPPLLAGTPAEEVAEQLADEPVDDDPVAAWQHAAARVRSALAADGVLDATVALPSGDQPVRGFLLELFADHLVHTWDLARAVGADSDLDRELVAACSTWFDDHEDDWREAGEIGPAAPVPADADPQARLLARFGRDPRWRPQE